MVYVFALCLLVNFGEVNYENLRCAPIGGSTKEFYNTDFMYFLH